MIISPPRETFRHTFVGRFLLVMFALLGGGLFYLLGDSTHETLFFYLAGGVVALSIAGWFILSKAMLTIHDEGIRSTTAFGVKEIEWREVLEYRYRKVNANAGAYHFGGILGLLIVSLANRSDRGRKAATNFYLQIISRSGTKIWVTSAYQHAYDAIGSIIERMHATLRPQVASEIAATGAAFGPIRLSARELQWKAKEPVPVSELANAGLVGSALQIKQTGKFLSLVNVRSDKVPNVLLLLEQIERLGVAPQTRDPMGSLFGRNLT